MAAVHGGIAVTSPSASDAALLVFVSAPAEAAAALARSLVEARLAACVQTLAMRSVYRWRGTIETADEVQLQIKTRRGLFDALRAHVRARHPYELPEIAAIDIADGLPEYLRWITDETS